MWMFHNIQEITFTFIDFNWLSRVIIYLKQTLHILSIMYIGLVAQLCPTLYDRHTWNFPGKNTGVGRHLWKIYGKNVETVTDFIFLGSKITVKSDCRHKIKTCLLLERKSLTNLDKHIKMQKHHFEDLSSQNYDFSSSHVWIWELNHKEGWWPKNGCFWFGCWRRLLRIPWTARRWNQSILKEISPECS